MAPPGPFFCHAWAQGLIFYPTVAVKRQGPWKVKLAKPLKVPTGSLHLTLWFSFFIFLLSSKLSKAFGRILVGLPPSTILMYSAVEGWQVAQYAVFWEPRCFQGLNLNGSTGNPNSVPLTVTLTSLKNQWRAK